MCRNVTRIRIGYGLGDLRFGASLEDVQAYLGVAQEIEEELHSPNPSITWQYLDLGINAYFSGDDDFRLGTMRIDSKYAELDRLALMGKPVREVRTLIERLNLGLPDEEHLTFSDSPPLHRLAFCTYNIEFWFKHKRLDSILWGYLIDNNDEICWP